MKKLYTLLFCCAFILNSFSYDLGFINMSFSDTLYVDEKFDIDWGCTILDQFGETHPALSVDVKFYFSNDEALDSSDVLIGSDVFSAQPETGYFSKRKYNLLLNSSLNIPLGKRYLIMNIDPENLLIEDNEGNNVRAYELYLFNRTSDLSILNKVVSKVSSDDNALMIETTFLNSGSVAIDSFFYNLSISNSEDGFSTPIYTEMFKEDGVGLAEREYKTIQNIDITNISLNENEFFIKWEISGVHIGPDGDVKNNTYIKTYSWSELPTVNLGTRIELMTNKRNDTVRTCDAIIYDDGGKDGNYSNNINSRIQIESSIPGQVVVLKINKGFGLFGFDDALQIYDLTVSGTTPVKTLYNGSSGSDHVFSSEGNLAVRFYTNGSSNNKGFTITVSCYDPINKISIPKTGITTISTCDKLIVDDGEFQNYSASSKGGITITPDVNGAKLKLSFIDFETETTNDYLEVFSGTSINSPLLNKYTGTNIPAEIITDQPDEALTLYFNSNNLTQKRGFIIKVTCDKEGVLVGDGFIPSNSKNIVYPNPNNGEFFLSEMEGLSSVVVYSMLGEQVYRGDSSLINLPSSVNKGVYVIEIQKNNGELFRSTFVIK